MKCSEAGLIAEYARNVISGGAKALTSYYFEPYYSFADGQWLVFGAADYIDQPNHFVGAVADPYEKWVLGFGFNWLPIPNARFRLAYMNDDYVGTTDSISGKRRDYGQVDFSAGLAF